MKPMYATKGFYLWIIGISIFGAIISIPMNNPPVSGAITTGILFTLADRAFAKHKTGYWLAAWTEEIE